MIKLTLEVKIDEEIGGPPDAMQKVMNRLWEVAELPVNGFKIVFVAADQEGADKIEAELDDLLADRAYRVIATVDQKREKRDLKRKKLEPGPTPIEKAIEASEGISDFARRRGVARVELSSGGRTVVLTEQTRRNAERALREMGMGADDAEDEDTA